MGFFEGSIKEDTPTNPESLYGISKDALRNMTKLICKNHNVIFQWLRDIILSVIQSMGAQFFQR